MINNTTRTDERQAMADAVCRRYGFEAKATITMYDMLERHVNINRMRRVYNRLMK